MGGPSGAEDSFLKSFDFGQDFFGVGLSLKIQEIRVLIVLNPQSVLDRGEHRCGLRETAHGQL